MSNSFIYQRILSSFLRATLDAAILTRPTKLGQLSREVVLQWMGFKTRKKLALF